MSILSRYAKQKRAHYNYYVSARIPDRLGHDFAAYCSRLNISVSEGIRLLIEAELNGQESAAADLQDTVDNTVDLQDTVAAAVQEARKDPALASITPADYHVHINGKRLAPCPICRDWSSAANFKRNHTNKHGYGEQGTAAFYAAHLPIIEEMIMERKD